MGLLLRGHDIEAMYALYEALNQDLAQAGLQNTLSASEPVELYNEDATRSDAATLIDVALVAVGAGGAATVAITAIAGIISKYIESNKVELLIEKEGQKVQVSGKADRVESILNTLWSQ